MTRRSYVGALAWGAAPLAFTGVTEAQDASMSEKPKGGALDLSGFGVKADVRTDDTAAIQKALDATANMGGTILLPAAKYLIAGSLKIPPAVGLAGVHDSPRWPAPLAGTVILATGGRDKEDAPALFEMGSGTLVRALTVFYPEQDASDIHAYPWSLHLQRTVFGNWRRCGAALRLRASI